MSDPRISTACLATLASWVRQNVQPLTGRQEDFDPLMDLVGDARIVMLGESTHGTAEFYATRARITQRLITEKGFNFVAIEGDWPAALVANRYAQGGSGTSTDALSGFKRFPAWMWRNTIVRNFLEWLRHHNDRMPQGSPKIGFYGLDLYSLHASMDAVLRFLERMDPVEAAIARLHYACFDPFLDDNRQYALSTRFLPQSCEEEVIQTLVEFMRHRHEYVLRSSEEDVFEVELHAIAVLHAERYYRNMMRGGAATWNLRDRHMVDTLNRLLARGGPESKAILWEHNSHIGDFRATHEGETGHINVGQLLRQAHGAQAVAIGFGTYRGSVTAAAAWDAPPEFMRIPAAPEGSYEAIFHQAGVPRFYLELRSLPLWEPEAWLYEERDERAIGVVYHPEHERAHNYVSSRLAKRYDAFLFFDETLAVEPLEPGHEPSGIETYPSGL